MFIYQNIKKFSVSLQKHLDLCSFISDFYCGKLTLIHWMLLIFQITNQEEERKVALTNRDRLKRMLTDKEEFVDKLKDARKSVYKVS